MDKEERKRVHDAVKRAFRGKVVGSTVTLGDRRTLTFAARGTEGLFVERAFATRLRNALATRRKEGRAAALGVERRLCALCAVQGEPRHHGRGRSHRRQAALQTVTRRFPLLLAFSSLRSLFQSRPGVLWLLRHQRQARQDLAVVQHKESGARAHRRRLPRTARRGRRRLLLLRTPSEARRPAREQVTDVSPKPSRSPLTPLSFRFRIALRNLTAERDTVERSLDAFRSSGFVNYFGLQRFGSRVDVPTYAVGRHILKENYEKVSDFRSRRRLLSRSRF